MRLIDADALWKAITIRIEEYADIADIMEIIEMQPIIEERKTGRWIHHDDKAYAGGGYEECSCCKWRCSEWVFIEDSHYCPNCGARMQKGEET